MKMLDSCTVHDTVARLLFGTSRRKIHLLPFKVCTMKFVSFQGFTPLVQKFGPETHGGDITANAPTDFNPERTLQGGRTGYIVPSAGNAGLE